MSPSIRRKLDALAERQQEVALLLADPGVLADNARFRALSKEFAQLDPLAQALRDYDGAALALDAARGMLAESDPELAALARSEVADLEQRREALDAQLHLLLLPRDPRDDANIFLEVRAGTGGDEAAIFAGDLLRMYTRYADRRGWRVEALETSVGDHGGYKKAVVRIEGQGAYSRLKFESGAHRVQRVPETEAQGRIHTSACTVAILPEVEAQEDVAINPADLKVDTYRSSGAGGRHVNKTTSTRPNRRYASRTCPAASSSSARPSARSTPTASARCSACAPSCPNSSARRSRPRPRSRAACRSARATAASASARTISRRAASPTIASTSRCTRWRT
jgi:peptide chain release factor 1